MYCPSCGKQNPDDSKFCESCGAPTGAGNGASQQKAAPPPPPPPPPQQTYAPPPPPQQQYYQQPPPAYPSAAASAGASVMTVGQYLGTIVLLSLPLVGFILMLVWAFGGDVNPNKKNLCRAMLILMAIGIVLGIIFGGIMGGIIANLINTASYY